MSEDALLEDVDIADLLQRVDIEDVLEQVDVTELLKRIDLESVLGGFGAAAGSELGVKLGRRLDSMLGTAEGESAAEPAGDEDETEPSDGLGGTDGATPESREDLEDRSYRELQSLTKDTDVKGNISKDRMVDELAEEFGFADE